MDESSGPAAERSPGASPSVVCRQCGHAVPPLEYCVRCGHPLVEELAAAAPRRERFAAAPEEPAIALSVFSTLFPQLPRAEMEAFRIAALVGVTAIVALAAAGLFALALVAAAALVPLITVLYLVDVDIYEDEPLRVMAATIAWGVVAGATFGYLLHALLPAGLPRATPLATEVLVRGVGVPIAGAALMLLGPLTLLRYRRFNDVLDGATFGATSAVCFTGAVVIVQAADLFAAGLRPPGDPLPWIVRLFSRGIAEPLLAGGAIGAACAALWLRYRAPVADRAALGVVGRPIPALALAGALLVAGDLAEGLPGDLLGALARAGLAAVALVWLRRTIHLGLLQEAREIEIGPPIACGNCGRSTPSHSFCGHCGISLRALPKERRPGDAGAQPAAGREP